MKFPRRPEIFRVRWTPDELWPGPADAYRQRRNSSSIRRKRSEEVVGRAAGEGTGREPRGGPGSKRAGPARSHALVDAGASASR